MSDMTQKRVRHGRKREVGDGRREIRREMRMVASYVH